MFGNRKKKPQTPEEAESSARANRSSLNHEIPFEDADPAQGEIPLDDLDTFVIPARDDKGVGIPITLHLPPYLERQLEIIVHSRRFPYLRSADFIRHAIVRHAHFLIGIRNSIPKHIVPAMQSVNDMFRDAELESQVQQAHGKMEKTISRYLKSGNRTEAIRMYVRIRGRIMATDKSHWRDQFIKDLDNQYAYLTQVKQQGHSSAGEDAA